MGRGKAEGLFSKAGGVEDAPFAQGVLDEGDVASGHRKLADAEADKDGDHGRIGSALAAEDNGLAGAVGRGNDVADEAQHAGMGSEIELGDVGVAPICSEDVLDEIVGADGEEIGFFS